MVMSFPIRTDTNVSAANNDLNSEFRMKRPNDMVCRLEILKHTVGKGHPMRNFFWGDENTLGGDGSKAHFEDLRQHLVQFHQEHYVGPNITIALQVGTFSNIKSVMALTE